MAVDRERAVPPRIGMEWQALAAHQLGHAEL